MIVAKFVVCASCLSEGVTDINCVCCSEEGYDSIELEFNSCECCGHIIDDGFPINSEFNTAQLKTLE